MITIKISTKQSIIIQDHDAVVQMHQYIVGLVALQRCFELVHGEASG